MIKRINETVGVAYSVRRGTRPPFPNCNTYARKLSVCLYGIQVVCAIFTGLLFPNIAQAQYAFTTISVPASGETSLSEISPHEVVGSFWDLNYENRFNFIINDEEFTIVEMPGATFVSIEGINASGDRVGAYSDAGFVFHAYVVTHEELKLIEIPGALFTLPLSINARGEVVGLTDNVDGTSTGFLWSDGDVDVIDFPSANWTVASGINDRGDVVGTYSLDGESLGFLLRDGVYTTLEVAGARQTQPTEISNTGAIVGYFVDKNVRVHGFVYKDGVYAVVDVPGATFTHIEDVNAKGEIVGAYGDEAGVYGFLGTPTHSSQP